MSRFVIRMALFAGVVSVTAAVPAYGQAGRVRISDAPSRRSVIRAQSPQPAYFSQPKKIIINPDQRNGPPKPMNAPQGRPVSRIPAQDGYVRLGAPMNPVPRPDIPYQVGSTFSTNQAFSPHEMLYPHSYRAMYPPYFYQVRGQWYSILGHMTNHEFWELKGTQVDVDYCSRIPLMSRFQNPILWFE